MKKEFVDIFKEYDKKNHRETHRYENVNIKIMMIKRNRAGEILNGAFYFKNPSSKGFTSYAINFYKPEKFGPIVDSIIKDDTFIKVQFADQHWYYIQNDVFEMDVFFDIETYHYKGLRIKGLVKLPNQWLACESDYIPKLFKLFENFRLSKHILSEKIGSIIYELDNAEKRVEYFENALNEAKEELKKKKANKQLVDDVIKSISESVDSDRYAEQKLLYELTKGSFK